MERIRVLVVEDQEALRNLMEKYLVRLGFEVESAPDAETALARFRAAESQFGLVLADMNMPVISGEELLRSILASNPNVRGILSSGYPISSPLLEQEYPGRTQFLQKPFSPKGLADTIHQLLDEPKPASKAMGPS